MGLGSLRVILVVWESDPWGANVDTLLVFVILRCDLFFESRKNRVFVSRQLGRSTC